MWIKGYIIFWKRTALLPCRFMLWQNLQSRPWKIPQDKDAWKINVRLSTKGIKNEIFTHWATHFFHSFLMGAEIQDLSEKGRENYAFPKKKMEREIYMRRWIIESVLMAEQINQLRHRTSVSLSICRHLAK